MSVKNKNHNKKAQRNGKKDPSMIFTKLVVWNPTTVYTDDFKLRPPGGQTYKCIKTINLGSIQQGAAASFGANSFTAATLMTDFSSMLGVFDRYRCLGLEVTFKPRANAVSATAQQIGQFYTVIDYDDAVVPSAISALQAYENCITSTAYTPVRRCFMPASATGVFVTGASLAATGVSQGMWMDDGGANALYYGIKYGYEAGTAGDYASHDVIVRSLWEFANAR